VPILVANHIINHSLFCDYSLWHEYALLLKENFKLMQSSQQEIFLSWINIGPDLGHSIELEGKKEDESLSLKDEQYKKIWQRDHLALIKDDIPVLWMKLYDSLVEDFGESSHPDLQVILRVGLVQLALKVPKN
jgi:hypothetical protein